MAATGSLRSSPWRASGRPGSAPSAVGLLVVAALLPLSSASGSRLQAMMTTTTTTTEGFDCLDGLEQAMWGWSEMKTKWCCDQQGLGCPEGYIPPTTTTTTWGSNDCSARQHTMQDWTIAERYFCCASSRLGCPEEDQIAAFSDSDGDSIKFLLTACGDLSYFVNGEQVLHHIRMLEVDVQDGRTLHLLGAPVGMYKPKRMTTVPEDQIAQVGKIEALFRMRIKVEPVYQFFNNVDNSFSYHMGEPREHETQVGLQFYAFPEHTSGTVGIYPYEDDVTNEIRFHDGKPSIMGEERGPLMFYAYKQKVQCTEPIIDLKRGNEHSLHIDSLRTAVGSKVVFYAFPPNAPEAPPEPMVSENAELTNCLRKDQLFVPLDIDGYPAAEKDDPTQCLLRCQEIPQCQHFVYYVEGGRCHVVGASAKVLESRTAGIVAGSKSCLGKSQVPPTLFEDGKGAMRGSRGGLAISGNARLVLPVAGFMVFAAVGMLTLRLAAMHRSSTGQYFEVPATGQRDLVARLAQ